MRNSLFAMLVSVCIPAIGGEVEVKLPISAANKSLQALADAQVFTMVDPEGVPYREQTTRLRITKVAISAGPGADQITWGLSGLFSVRSGVGVTGNVQIRGTSTIAAEVAQSGVKVASCLDVQSISIHTYDPVLNAVIGGLKPMWMRAARGYLRLCAQFASPVEAYFPAWQQYGVASATASVNPTDATIGVKLVFPDSPALKNSAGMSPAILMLLED